MNYTRSNRAKNILIVGGAGLLGSTWADEVKDCFNISVTLHKNSSVQRFDYRYVNLSSITEIEALFAAVCPSIVVNCAGLASVEACQLDPQRAYFSNVAIPVNLASVCAQSNITFVQISTDHLFPDNKGKANENDQAIPVNIYAKTKMQAEIEVQRLYPRSIVVRTNFFGQSLSHRKSFSDQILQVLRKNEEIKLFEDVYFTPILMQSLIRKVHDLVEFGAYGVFNVVSDDRISKYEFGRQLAKVFELDVALIKASLFSERNDLVLRPFDLSLSNEKVTNVLGQKIESLSSQLARLKQTSKMLTSR